MTRFRNPLFCAIDTPDIAHARDLVRAVKPHAGGIKLGLEFFSAHGPAGVESLSAEGLPVFIDLKLHDIPNTVCGAARALMRLNPAVLTVHVSGGEAMMRSVRDAVENEADRLGVAEPWLVGVTVLTSLDAGDLDALGIEGSTHRVVARLAKLAEKAGLDGVVCAPHEISTTRSTTRPSFRLVVPGIRPRGSDADDQKRVLTPAEAVGAGADIIVVGRPVARADDPGAAARAIAKSIAGVDRPTD